MVRVIYPFVFFGGRRGCITTYSIRIPRLRMSDTAWINARWEGLSAARKQEVMYSLPENWNRFHLPGTKGLRFDGLDTLSMTTLCGFLSVADNASLYLVCKKTASVVPRCVLHDASPILHWTFWMAKQISLKLSIPVAVCDFHEHPIELVRNENGFRNTFYIALGDDDECDSILVDSLTGSVFCKRAKLRRNKKIVCIRGADYDRRTTKSNQHDDDDREEILVFRGFVWDRYTLESFYFQGDDERYIYNRIASDIAFSMAMRTIYSIDFGNIRLPFQLTKSLAQKLMLHAFLGPGHTGRYLDSKQTIHSDSDSDNDGDSSNTNDTEDTDGYGDGNDDANNKDAASDAGNTDDIDIRNRIRITVNASDMDSAYYVKLRTHFIMEKLFKIVHIVGVNTDLWTKKDVVSRN